MDTEKEYFDSEEFFAGCREAINRLFDNLESQLNRQRSDAFFAINALKNGTMKVNHNDSSLTSEEQLEKSIQEWKQQLDIWSITNFSVIINKFCNQYTGHLWHNDLLIIDKALKVAEDHVHELSNIKSDKNSDFINTILKAIKELQNQDTSAECVRLIKDEQVKHEAQFRNWFKTYFVGKYSYVNAEPEKGSGRIDLKIEDPKINTKIIEFKGWWNNDKKQIVSQISSYLTDFESDGYIIIINDKRKNVENEYFEKIKSDSIKYVKGTYQVCHSSSGYKYFISQHFDNIRTKMLYHFIINVY
ncbi:hypothetical protein [Cyclobacterium marinum]|uniref:hypothetical protein n=1 Tax=Cyclobacterium marinum TaxID=104 RepID=UPI0011EF97C4|nr:hypothetical protein [Cyclobacterium marinum]MBI0400402.1 hypothetical protein [Cyclobacterium marinum]